MALLLHGSTLLKVPKRRDLGEQIQVSVSESQPSVWINGRRHEASVVCLGKDSGIYGMKGASSSRSVSSKVAQKLFVKADLSAGRSDDRPKVQLMGPRDAGPDVTVHADDSRQRTGREKAVLRPEYLEESDLD